jgi:polysaccharide pyruvyl transferase WcaK-like protein
VSDGPRILLYGYHGLRNAGAESRLCAIVHVLRQRFPTARIQAVSFDRRNLAYLSGVDICYVNPALYRAGSRRLIEASDVVVLTEGNLLSDAFTAQMVEVHTTVMEMAHRAGVPVAGLALDCGPLSPSRVPRVMRAVNQLRLLTLRTPAAATDLRERGLTIPAKVTADCAVTMPLPGQGEKDAVAAKLGLNGPAVHGLAPVDFFMYPAKIAPVGRPRDYVRYPFKGTWPGGGRERSAELVRQWVSLGRAQLAENPGATVAVLAMDPSDQRIAQEVYRGIGDPSRLRLISCKQLNTVQISAVTSRLTSVVTSRYHALVMPLAYQVPFVALGHDNRMRYITAEMGLERYFVSHDAPGVADALADCHRRLLKEQDELRACLKTVFEDFQRRDQENYELLGEVVREATGRAR